MFGSQSAKTDEINALILKKRINKQLITTETKTDQEKQTNSSLAQDQEYSLKRGFDRIRESETSRKKV